MTFDAILDQVITILKRQGRVSYPSLKRRFALDDNYLEDLKTELFYVHPVVDDDGKGLLWTGEVDSQPASSSTPLAQQEEQCGLVWVSSMPWETSIPV